MITCYHTELAGFDITLEQAANKRFRVTYGLQQKKNLSYEQAALELGACMMHALACEDKLYNTGE